MVFEFHASEAPIFLLAQFQNKLGELLSIVNGSFDAFVDIYKCALPPTNNVEYQFIMGLLGIVTNVSASPEGREFLIRNTSGLEFVRKIIKLTPELPLVSGSLSLKRYPEESYIIRQLFHTPRHLPRHCFPSFRYKSQINVDDPVQREHEQNRAAVPAGVACG